MSWKGSGTSWQANDRTWLAPVNPQGCSYRYLKSSHGVGGEEQVTATYTITWNVTWTGSDGTSGAFNNMQTQTTSRFAVDEVQTVVVRWTPASPGRVWPRPAPSGLGHPSVIRPGPRGMGAVGPPSALNDSAQPAAPG